MIRRRGIGIALSGLLTITLLTTPATAQDVDALIAEIGAISQEASTQNEQVKVIELDIQGREDSIGDIKNQQSRYRDLADRAAAAASDYRGEIDRIAQAKYRGTVIDPLTLAISADNPQNAIDRMSYLATLATSTSEVVESLNEARDDAADNLDDVNRMKAQADFELAELRTRLETLGLEQEELERRKEEITQRVDELSPAQRQLWVDKNGPLDIDIASFLGTPGQSVAAVQAALSKIGSPYGWGAVGPSDFDCSGLIYWAFQQQGKTLPRTSQAQMAGGTAVSREQLQPGDVIGYYPGATHVGLYIGDGMIVHASDYGIPVQVVSVDSAPFHGARRY